MRYYLFGLFLIGVLQISQAADYTYTVRWLAPHLHTYVVELEVRPEAGAATVFGMPIWRPGRYRDQHFAAGVSAFVARDEKGASLPWHQPDPDHWSVSHGKAKMIRIQYHVRAENPDAGSSVVGPREIYLNPIGVCMFVGQNYEGAVSLRMPELPASWKVASAMPFDQETKSFQADSYHTLVDCPVVCAPEIRQLQFELEGTRFWLHFQGDYQGDTETDAAILDAVKKVCQEQGAIFGSYPFEEFHFIYRLLPSRYRHAVEHSNSVSFAVPADVTLDSRRIVNGLASLTAHEFFHAWNVKRIRPANLWPYDYSRPQHSSLHWFTEGVTDYYSFLTLVRAGIWDEAKFLKRQSQNLNSWENSYAAQTVSVSAISMASWVEKSPYRPNEWQASYYPLGFRLGFLMDLHLRKQTKGKVSLDDLMRYLYQTYYQQDQGVPEKGIQMALETLSGESWADFFQDYIDGVQPFDFPALLKPFGLRLTRTPEKVTGLRAIGVVQHEEMEQGLLLRSLQAGSDARQAGLSEGELILEVDGQRVNRLDLEDYFAKAKKGQRIQIQALTFGGLQTLELIKTGAFSPLTVSLERINAKNNLRADWLRSQSK